MGNCSMKTVVLSRPFCLVCLQQQFKGFNRKSCCGQKSSNNIAYPHVNIATATQDKLFGRELRILAVKNFQV